MNIILVYNAESGLINTLFDIGHKILSPDTYSCQLCSITHGLFKEKEEWVNYKRSSQHSLEFLHKDEFNRKYSIGMDLKFPVILQQKDDKTFNILIRTEDINKLRTIQELIEKLPR